MRVSVTDAYQPVEVELWGAEFETVEVTKSVRKKLAPATKQLVAIESGVFHELDGNEGLSEEELDLKAIACFGAILDVRLRSIDSKRTKPSVLLKRAYDEDKISIARALGILGAIGRADLPS